MGVRPFVHIGNERPIKIENNTTIEEARSKIINGKNLGPGLGDTNAKKGNK